MNVSWWCMSRKKNKQDWNLKLVCKCVCLGGKAKMPKSLKKKFAQ